MTRYLEVKRLKDERKDLLEKVGLSRAQFYRKMPRVRIKADGTWEVIDKNELVSGFRHSSGKKPSLKQQVEWLREFEISTRELREELLEKLEEQNELQPEEEMSDIISSQKPKTAFDIA